MRGTLQKAATSLALIVIVALGVRLGFAWNEARKIAPGVLGNVPFQQETGNIAYALGAGQGVQRCVSNGDGADGLAGAGLSVDCCGDVQVAWSFYGAGFFCLRCAEHSFFGGGVCADFLCRKEGRRIGSGGRSGVALGSFSEWRDDAVRVDLGYVAVSASRGFDFVGDFGASRVGEMARLGCVRSFVGIGVDDESGAGLAAAILAGVGGVSRTRGKRNALEARGAGGWCSHSVLLAVDRA